MSSSSFLNWSQLQHALNATYYLNQITAISHLQHNLVDGTRYERLFVDTTEQKEEIHVFVAQTHDSNNKRLL